MNGRERILACFVGEPTDSLPFMPITMMFAADQVGVPYGDYATYYRNLVEGQLRTAEAFDIDYVSCISDPAREAADCGAPPTIWRPVRSPPPRSLPPTHQDHAISPISSSGRRR